MSLIANQLRARVHLLLPYCSLQYMETYPNYSFTPIRDLVRQTKRTPNTPRHQSYIITLGIYILLNPPSPVEYIFLIMVCRGLNIAATDLITIVRVTLDIQIE